jgi:hypothetical protein
MHKTPVPLARPLTRRRLKRMVLPMDLRAAAYVLLVSVD